MAYNTAGGMNPDFSEFEEILNMQTQGRRLSDMQLRSLNQFVQRRCSNAGGPMNMSAVQMPSQYPPMGQMGPPMGQMGQHQMMNDSYLSAAQHYQNNLSNYGNDRNWIESKNPDPNRQDMNMGFSAHQQASDQRRRSSMAMYNNFINEMGSGYNPNGTERRRSNFVNEIGSGYIPDDAERRRSNFITEMGSGYNPDGTERWRVMEKRTSLDLLGDAALQVSNQDHQLSSTAAAGHTSMGPMDNTPRRSSLDFLVSGDSTLGRRNSLTQLLASEFAKPSRRSSMATGTKPIDPFHMDNLFDDQQAKLAAAGRLGSGIGFPSNHTSELGFQNSQTNGPDMITLQLLQQQNAEEEHALSSVEDYIQLQKLQTKLRRQSITNMFDEITMMHRMNQSQGNDPMQMAEIFSPEAQAQLESFQIYEENQHKKHNQTVRKRAAKKPEPEPEPEDNEVPPFTDGQMDSFQTSMEKSTKTQKDIQGWDKKMGLKRSHSATMTKTTRTRKSLKKILDKHRNILKEIEITDNHIPEETLKAESEQGSEKGSEEDDEV